MVALTFVVTLPGCGASDAAPTTTPTGVPATVALGGLPGPLSGALKPPAPPTTEPAATTSTAPPIPRIVGTIGEAVDGPRVLVIGDSVMATIAPRNDGIACDVLPTFGWQVEIAAEPGRFVEFGEVVLDKLLRPESGDDWDAVAVMLGNQFDGDIDQYRAATRRAPRANLAAAGHPLHGQRSRRPTRGGQRGHSRTSQPASRTSC